MAVTASLKRTMHTETASTTEEYGTLTLAGGSTYTTGGFVVLPFTVLGPAGSSPQAGKTVLAMTFFPPSGYIYTSTTVGNNMTIKILSAPGTELANATAVPDTTIPFVLVKTKL